MLHKIDREFKDQCYMLFTDILFDCFVGIDPVAFKTVIQFIYTHDRSLITSENMSEILIVADFLQCTEIRRLGVHHIIDHPTNGTFPLHIRYSDPKVNKVVFYDITLDTRLGLPPPVFYLRNHYLDIILHPDFVRNIIDVDDLEYFINPAFPLKREWHVPIFQVIVKWLEFSESRKIYASELLRKVSYECMTTQAIREKVLPFIPDFPGCEDLVEQLRGFVDNVFEQPFLTGSLPFVGGRKCDQKFIRPVLHAFGMHGSVEDKNAKAFCVKTESKEGEKRYTLSHWPVNCDLGVVEPRGDVIGHYAFIVGGYEDDLETGRYKLPSATCKRFNMNTGEMLDLAPLPQASAWNAVVIHPKEHQMWVLGGLINGDQHVHLSQSVYIYDIKTNQWKEGPSLPEPMVLLAACYSPHSPEGIIISGGMVEREDEHGARIIQSAIYYMSSERKFWEQLETLRVPRIGHAMCVDTSNDEATLYVMGGLNKDNEEVDVVELYSDSGNQQFKVTGLKGSLTIHDAHFYTFSEEWANECSLMQIGSLPECASDPSLDSRMIPFRLHKSTLQKSLILSCTQEVDMDSGIIDADSDMLTVSLEEEQEDEEE